MTQDQAEMVVLVNEEDQELGTMEKLQAHREGALHRAFSVFIFNKKGELLLQKRAGGKYHSGGLWTNTCCSHPRPGETPGQGANRRLKEEMGLNCRVKPAFTFKYRADMGNGLTEHELDHVYTGVSDDVPVPDKNEVADWKYITLDELDKQLKAHPKQFTEWFRLCYEHFFFEIFI
jgi:isopentenyl-diphosphate delta-isomerase